MARERPDWLTAIMCFLLGTLLAVAYIFYQPEQSPWNTTDTSVVSANPVGVAGAVTGQITFFTIGIAGWLLPFFMLWFFYLALRKARRLAGTRFAAMLLCLVTGAGLAAMVNWGPIDFDPDYYPQGLGGLVGTFLYEKVLLVTIGNFGSGLLLGTVYAASFIFILTKDISAEFARLGDALVAWQAKRKERKAALVAAKAEAAAAQAKEAEKEKSAKPERASKGAAAPATAVGPTSGKTTFAVAPTDSAPKIKPPPRAEPAAEPKLEMRSSATRPAVPASKAPEPAEKPPAESAATPPSDLKLNIVHAAETRRAKATVPQSSDENYKFPEPSLLREQVTPDAESSEEEHRRNAENLLRILKEFGVEVSIGEIHVGPVITRYEVIPAPGVRVEKIAGLDKNIALGMRAQSVRILAPIPGKAAVGVEVPNQHPTAVGIREILESEDWANTKADLPIALGKDVSGKPLVSDLTRMPHLLIAGATGSGKSVCINSIIASILYSKSPRDLRLIMIDPKVVELKIFNPLPHMLIPVVTEPKKVPGALKWLLAEMEQRYQQFAKVNVRNIAGYNSRKKTDEPDDLSLEGSLTGEPALNADEIELPDRLPYIVVIIDELADLMMVAPAEIENSIARLAQLARAAGIHLIIATQRPSVNVITGVIKANLPSRIAFQVASQVDSRTILDTKGADNLIGRGDMLFSPPGTSRLVRAQGAFVSDDEVQALVDFLKVNGPPIYAEEVQAQIERAASPDEGGEGEGGDDLGDDEELFQQALDVLRSTKRASTSMIQRRLRIGYNRAARIMDLMEDKGIVGPENGSNPREILVDLDNL